LENRACGPAFCNFSMWHRHTPCRRSCPILRFPVVWATGSGAWPCGYSLKEGTFPLPNQRRHPPQTPGSRSAFPWGQWGEYETGSERRDKFARRKMQKSCKPLKRLRRKFQESSVAGKLSPLAESVVARKPGAWRPPLSCRTSPPQVGRSLCHGFPLLLQCRRKRESGGARISPLVGEMSDRTEGGASPGRFGTAAAPSSAPALRLSTEAWIPGPLRVPELSDHLVA
jgi:hypothetical protein